MLLNRCGFALVREATRRTGSSAMTVSDQIVPGGGGRAHASAEPQSLYRQHGDNLVASNRGMLARVRRLCMTLNGRFFAVQRGQYRRMHACRCQFSPEAVDSLNAFRAHQKGQRLEQNARFAPVWIISSEHDRPDMALYWGDIGQNTFTRLLDQRMTVLVTGGAGFIGSCFVRGVVEAGAGRVVTLDVLGYAGFRDNLDGLDSSAHRLVQGSIGDSERVLSLLAEEDVSAVVNFAAETHVDRSISGPEPFFQTNVMATLGLLSAVRRHRDRLPQTRRDAFRFIHVSTDEVYGTLAPDEPAFTEATPYRPNSPYAASKAASDHLVRAFAETYGLPAIITNCSNNYGPRQYPEKLIPLMILNALHGKPLPVYGDGLQVRDWLYVGDHCAALRLVLAEGRPGETYNIGGNCERTNIEVVRTICAALDRLSPRADGRSYAGQITHVADRPGHDRRYAVDTCHIRAELGWQPQETFATGIARTIAWYLDNPDWLAAVTSGAYQDWIVRQYA